MKNHSAVYFIFTHNFILNLSIEYNIDKSKSFKKYFYEKYLSFVYNDFLIYFHMKRESKYKFVRIWIEEIWEEIEIQCYGIICAILFFAVIYFIFQPLWMRTVFHLFWKIKLTEG